MENRPEYDFDMIELIKKAFANLAGIKGTFVVAFVLYVFIAIVLQLVLGSFFPSPPPPADPHYLNQIIVTVLSYPVLMPLMTGIIMLAIHYSRGEEIRFKSIFDYYHLTGKLALSGILVYFMTVIGFIFFVIPGIYLSIAYVFTLPLIADKGMDVWEAMELSRKMVTKQWFKVFGLMFILSLLFLIALIPFGIGLIWAVPLMFIALYGLLYRVIFDEMEE